MEGVVEREPSQFRLALRAMGEQWESMMGMAAMFMVTILIAIWIQPFYDKPEFRAFGEAGASQVRNIAIEFVMIMLFTVAIIFLAKWKKEWIIKYGILAILFIALGYATIPLAHKVVPDPGEPFELDLEPTPIEVLFQDGEAVWGLQPLLNETTGAIGGHAFYRLTDAGSEGGVGPLETRLRAGVVMMSNASSPGISQYDGGIIACDGEQWMRVHDDFDVSVDSEKGVDCALGLESDFGSYYVDSAGSLALLGSNSSWDLPTFVATEQPLRLLMLPSGQALWVSEQRVALLDMPRDAVDAVSLDFEYEHDAAITAASLGTSLWPDVMAGGSGSQSMLVIGDANGSVLAWQVDLNGTTIPQVEERMHLDRDVFTGQINGILLANYNHYAQDELFVIDSENLRMFRGSSLIEELNHSLSVSEPVAMGLVLAQSVDIDSVIIFQGGDGWEHGGLGWRQFDPSNGWAFALGLVVAIGLMATLYIRPEWYVVNSVGILVGAGVVAMLGISFVPWLIIIFMVAAAIYDAWAVYHSKHMLDLADTMVNLKLPILLVAPQEKGYSFLDETDVMKERVEAADAVDAGLRKAPSPTDAASGPPAPEDWERAAAAAASRREEPEKSSREAMFMGLGDVIFPGMLVVSAVTWLPEGTLLLGVDATLWVGIATMLGGLAGYFVLMGYVALGRPQAGLPLLNSGSILGYLISTLLLLGAGALEFNITF